MIRINLLGVERQQVKKKTSLFDPSQRAAFGCCLVFGFTLLGVGSWYWSLTSEASRLENQISLAQQELARLQVVLAEVSKLEATRARLEERVKVIEELRRGQSVPVQLLDHVSRSVPDLLWLTALDQKADVVSIEGRTTTLISLADFVANLGGNKLVSKPIDIVNSEVDATGSERDGAEVIRFSVKAPLAQAATPPAPAAAPTGAAAAATTAAAR